MANLSSKTGTITTPVQTQISLANNATTSVQDMSAYDAQEVMGFVYVDATADLRAYFTVTVVKNGAGTYEIAGADIAGDQSGTGASAIAPVSFSMSGSILQATLPNITGFASAYLRYQLSAPYLGGNYPLSVDASQLVSGTVGAARLPAANSTTQGAVAPRRGQQALTVTSSASGWSTTRAVGIYYQDQDGNHRLRFNVAGLFTSKPYTTDNFIISGVTWKNVANFFQPVAAMLTGSGNGSIQQAYCVPGASGTVTVLAYATSGNLSGVAFSGDVELESRPSWA